MIKVSKETHLALKVGASNRGISMKEFVKTLADKNIQGVPFDVDEYNFDTLLSVFQDIAQKICNHSSTEEQVDELLLVISEINEAYLNS